MAKGGSGEAGRAPVAMLRGDVVGQEVRITSDGVSRLTLCLSSELVDLDQPVTVVWNDKEKLQRIVERDFADARARPRKGRLARHVRRRGRAAGVTQ